MLEIESFKKWKISDLIALLILLSAWILGSLAIKKIVPSLSISIAATAVILTLTTLIIRKVGAVSLFCLSAGMIGTALDIFEITKYGVTILLLSGILFEIFLLVIKIEIKNIPLDVILASSFAMASIPWSMKLYLLQVTIQSETLINMSLILFIAGIIGSVCGYLIWNKIKLTKLLIHYECLHEG